MVDGQYGLEDETFHVNVKAIASDMNRETLSGDDFVIGKQVERGWSDRYTDIDEISFGREEKRNYTGDVYYPKLIKGKATNATFTVVDDNMVWKSGRFEGEWRNGTWGNGEFKGNWFDGYWVNGTFIDGTFDHGEWEDGVWLAGKWNPSAHWVTGKDAAGVVHTKPPYLWWSGFGKPYTGLVEIADHINADVEDAVLEFNTRTREFEWKSGTFKKGWIRNVTWEDGVFKDGVVIWLKWYGGFFENGVWRNGNFLGGVWENGVWLDGVFSNAKWMKGKFLSGTFNGEWMNGEAGGRTPQGVISQGGPPVFSDALWHDGTFYSGAFRDGVWLNGTFGGMSSIFRPIFDGTWKDGVWMPYSRWQGKTWERGRDEKGMVHLVSPDKRHEEQASERFSESVTEAVERGQPEPLPDTLYHVTTAARAVRQGGKLKTRSELGVSPGKGLGGGASDTISLTDNLEEARNIRDALRLARDVVIGERHLDDLIDDATKGVGAKRPWIGDMWAYHGSKDGSIPDGMQLGLEGMSYERKTLAKSQFQVPGDWVPVDDGIVGADGERRYREWVRPMTDEETRQFRDQFLKEWFTWRGYAGGPPDPVFFGNEFEGLAAVDEDDIAILEVWPKPGAVGVRMSAMGEWRVKDGSMLEIRGIEESLTEAKKYLYHGTAGANMKSILKNGVQADPEKRVWGELGNVRYSGVSKQSYGGVYLTPNLMTAKGAGYTASREDKKKVILLLIVRVETKTLLPDEDNVIGAVQSAFERLNEPYLMNEYQAVVMWLRWKSGDESVEEAITKKTYDAMDWLVELLPDDDDTKQRIRGAMLHDVKDALLAYMVRQASVAYWQEKRKGKWSDLEEELGIELATIPSIEQAEVEMRAAVDKMMRHLRRRVYGVGDPSGYWSNARSVQDIGWSGANRIVGMVRVTEEKTPGGELSFRNVLHVERLSEPAAWRQFIADWEERVGKYYRVEWGEDVVQIQESVTSEMDRLYLEAVDAGDTESVRDLVELAAKEAVASVDALDVEDTFVPRPGETVGRVIWEAVPGELETNSLDAVGLSGPKCVRALHWGDTDYWIERLALDYDRDPEDAKVIIICISEADRLVEDVQYMTDPDTGEKAESGILLTARKVLQRGIDFVLEGENFTTNDIPPSATLVEYDEHGKVISLSRRFGMSVSESLQLDESAFDDKARVFVQSGYSEAEVKAIMDEFRALKKANKLPGEAGDISRYATIDDVRAAVEAARGPKVREERVAKYNNIAGLELVKETGEYGLFRVDTKEASCVIGSGTKWCTSSEKSNEFERLQSLGVRKYVYISKVRGSGDALYKVAIAVYPGGELYEVYDARDERLAAVKDGSEAPILRELGIRLSDMPGELPKVYEKDESTGIIYDAETGLEWLVGPDKDTDYAAAELWIASLSDVSGGGWRMPTVAELRTLYQPGVGSHNIDPAFRTTGWWVWGEPLDASSAWNFSFNDGSESWNSRSSSYYNRVFAVRPRR